MYESANVCLMFNAEDNLKTSVRFKRQNYLQIETDKVKKNEDGYI